MKADTLCLAILSRGDATGYEIRKLVSEGPFSHFYKAGFGSIYPALRRLVDREFLVCRDEHSPGRPDRKIYTITAPGRQELTATLCQPSGPDVLRSDFLFTLFFSDLAPNHAIRATIESRLQWLRAAIAELTDCADIAMARGEQFVAGYGLALYRASEAYLDAHRHDFDPLTPPIEKDALDRSS